MKINDSLNSVEKRFYSFTRVNFDCIKSKYCSLQS